MIEGTSQLCNRSREIPRTQDINEEDEECKGDDDNKWE